METETWLAVVGHEKYSISSLGRFRNSRGWIGYQVLNDKGYWTVKVHNGRKANGVCRQASKPVHVLVCQAFHGPKPFPEAHAAHGNGDPLDNRASNLRWASPKENAADREAHGTLTRGGTHWRAKLSDADVLAIKALLPKGLPYGQIGAQFGVKAHTIGSIARGRTWAHLEPAILA